MEEDDPSNLRCVRLARLNKLFDKHQIANIEEMALAIHEMAEKVTYLFKMVVLEKFVDTNDFTHEWATSFAKDIDLSKENFIRYFAVIGKDPENTCGRPPKGENKEKRDFILDALRRHNVLGEPMSKTNASSVLTYEAELWSTAFTNNIKHFDKYIKDCVQVLADENVVSKHPELRDVSKWDWEPDFKKLARASRNKWVKNLLYVCDDDKKVKRNLDGIPPALLTMVPTGYLDPKKRHGDFEKKPELFLVYMVHMNRWLEDRGKALFSPFPIRTTFIPAHFTMDTHVLVHMSKLETNEEPVEDTIEEEQPLEEPTEPPKKKAKKKSKTQLKKEAKAKVDASWKSFQLVFTEKLQQLAPSVQIKWDKLTSKSHLLYNPEDYLNGTIPPKITGLWKTAIWQTLTKIPDELLFTMYNKTELKFNNMIYVNGYKASMHYCSNELYGTSSYAKGKKKGKSKKETNEEERGENAPTLLTPEEQDELMEANLGFVDPGKNKLITITNGYFGGPKLQYTAQQRRNETGSTHAAYYTNHKLKWYNRIKGVNLKEIQSTLGNSKTCYLDVFTEYVRKRNSNRQVLSGFYQQNFFRRVQMRALVQSRSSLDKLVHNIKKTFNGPNDPVTLVYGNWSQTALRYQPPTQGIGLRRFLAKHFRMIVIDEHKTSQRCPCNSQHETEHPKGCKSRKNKKGHQRDWNHGVLRCKNNEKCKSMTWDRDVLSTVNMRIKMRYEWRHNNVHPCFLRANTEENAELRVGAAPVVKSGVN